MYRVFMKNITLKHYICFFTYKIAIILKKTWEVTRLMNHSMVSNNEKVNFEHFWFNFVF
jgi:hypothetical protein